MVVVVAESVDLAVSWWQVKSSLRRGHLSGALKDELVCSGESRASQVAQW